MTPADEARAAAWLSEMWRPIKEYHQTDAERAAAWGRQQAVNGAGDEPKKGAESAA